MVAMPPDPADRVRGAIPGSLPCDVHGLPRARLTAVPVLEAVGTLDRVDRRLGQRWVVVAFSLRLQDTRLVVRCTASELALA